MSGSLILPLALASSIEQAAAAAERGTRPRRVRLRADEVADPPIEVAGHGARAGASSSTPPAPAPRPARSNISVVLATAQPLFTPPIASSSRTRTSVRNTSLNIERPVISLSGRMSTPGWCTSQHEVGDPLVLRDVGIGAGQEHADVGDLRARRPDLLPVDDPLVAVLDRRGGEAGEVGAGAGLAEELAPRLAAGDGVADVALLLLVGAVHRDRGRREQRAEPHRRAQRPELVDGLLDADAVLTREALAVPVGGKCGERPPGAAEPVPPLADGEVGVPVLLEPARDLVDDVDARVGDVDHGSPCGGGVARPSGSPEQVTHDIAMAWRRDEWDAGCGAAERPAPQGVPAAARKGPTVRSRRARAHRRNRTRRGSAGGDGSAGSRRRRRPRRSRPHARRSPCSR